MVQDLSHHNTAALAGDFDETMLVAGHHVLDFTNTLSGWGKAAPRDRIDGYVRLAQWSIVAGVMEPALADILAMKSSLEPEETQAALENARLLRALLHHIFAAHAQGLEPAYDDMLAFEGFWKQAIGAHRLAYDGPHIEIRPVAFTSLTIIADLITRDAVDLMKTMPNGRLRLCANDDCGWLYLAGNALGKARYCGGPTCLNQK